MDPKEIESLIARNLPSARVEVHTDGLGHYEALVVSSEFAGKRSIARHQLVYGALGGRVGREIHALALKTFTPDEWTAAGGGLEQ
ncbi:MAG TPA: BolA/IbaG family iron-sulfur metabolism protein [Gammaproteobacteria bacterium]|nr:BolA/IbaG family iron-sulfur metabolism protein [Gammaproteobacteria bacterium]